MKLDEPFNLSDHQRCRLVGCDATIPMQLGQWWEWHGDWVRLGIDGPGFPSSPSGIFPESWGPLFFCGRAHAAEFLMGDEVERLLEGERKWVEDAVQGRAQVPITEEIQVWHFNRLWQWRWVNLLTSEVIEESAGTFATPQLAKANALLEHPTVRVDLFWVSERAEDGWHRYQDGARS